MLKLDRYVLRQLVVAFVVAAGGMLFIALPGIAVAAVHKLAGVGTMAVLKIIPMIAAGFTPFVLPIAMLLAVVATYGRIAADREWTAILMAGVNPFRMVVPGLIFGLGVSGIVFAMNSEMLPWINYKQRALKLSLLRDVVKNLSPGRTELSYDRFFLTANQRIGDVFHDVFIEVPDPEVEGETQSLFAATARFTFDDETMRVDLTQVRGADRGATAKVEKMKIAVPLDRVVEKHPEPYTAPRYQNTLSLYRGMHDDALDPHLRLRYVYNFHERLANAATCLMFVLLGVPTGVFLRKGTQLAALSVAVGFAIAYWITALRVGEELTMNRIVPPAVGGWAPFAAWTAGAALLCWWVLRR